MPAHKGCRPIGMFKQGNIPWNKGLTKEIDTRVKFNGLKISKARKGKKLSKEHIEKMKKGIRKRFNKMTSKEKKQKMSRNPVWNKGLTKESSDKIKKATNKMYATKKRLGQLELSEKRLKKMRLASQIKPNKLELKFAELIKNFPYKYVGDGQIWINRKNPDFFNVNGQKKIIELFGRYWHKSEDEMLLKKHYGKYGYKTLVVWEEELNNPKILINKIERFDRL